MDAQTIKAVIALCQSQTGVDYTRKYGAICPLCGTPRAWVRRTMPWNGKIRERYHKCRKCGFNFKSVETE